MADVAKRLAGPSLFNNTTANTVYTVPASTTTIIRGIIVNNSSLNAPNFTMSIGADAAGTRIFSAVTVAVGEVFDWSGFLVMNATEILTFTNSIANSLVIIVNGIEVS